MTDVAVVARETVLTDGSISDFGLRISDCGFVKAERRLGIRDPQSEIRHERP
jgi:hypothetical protein